MNNSKNILSRQVLQGTGILLLLLKLIPAVVYAEQSQQSHQEILKTATHFINNHYQTQNNDSTSNGFELHIIPLDARLKVKACNQKIEPFWPYEPGRQRSISVGIRCTGDVRWKLFLQAKIKRIKTVAVLNTSVSAGDVLTLDVISMREIDILPLRDSAIEDVTSLLGMNFSKSIRSGAVLAKKHLKLPFTVKRGDFVEILSGDGPIQVRAQGLALADGHINDMVKVRNSSSNIVVQAYVVKAGYVKTVQ